MEGAKYVCSPPPRDEAEPEGLLAGAGRRRVPNFLVRPLPVPLRRPAGKLIPKAPHQLPLGSERHSRRGDPAADPVLRGRGQGPHHAEPVRGPDLDQPCQDVRAPPAEGHDRGRRGRRHRDLGPGRKETIRQETCTTAPTTRPMRYRGDGLADDHRARRSSPKTARSAANPATALSSNATCRPSPNRAAKAGCPPDACGAIAHPRSIRSRGLTGHTPFGSLLTRDKQQNGFLSHEARPDTGCHSAGYRGIRSPRRAGLCASTGSDREPRRLKQPPPRPNCRK